MKRIRKEQIVNDYMPKLRALVEENPIWAGAMPEVRSIVHWDDVARNEGEDGISEALFNKIVLGTPLTLILKLRAHGIDFPKYEYGEKLED